MSCERCGAELDLYKETGATDEGSFTEYYECEGCGAKGVITGDAADPPKSWSRNGPAFNER